MADKIYFTITGTGFFEGDEFFEKGYGSASGERTGQQI